MEYCPQCDKKTKTSIYRKGEPQPADLPETDMEQALHGRDEMRFCSCCGLDRDADW